MMKFSYFMLCVCILCGCEIKEKPITAPSTITHKQNCDSLNMRPVTLDKYTQKVILESYDFYANHTEVINQWVNDLDTEITNSLLDKKKLIHKKYYLYNIELENYDKVEKIQIFDSKVEQYLDHKLGMYQGIPSVLYTTSIISLEHNEPNEYFTLELNQLAY